MKMTLATMITTSRSITKEERMALEQELIDNLLYHKNGIGIGFPFIQDRYWRIGIWNPWDLFEFCQENDIWIQIRRNEIDIRWNAKKNRQETIYENYYRGIKLKQATVVVNI
jgi:hypothetical protein